MEHLPLILVPPFVILLIPHACEHSPAISALVGLLPSVGPHVDHEIAFLGEGPQAVEDRAFEKLQTRMDCLQVQI